MATKKRDVVIVGARGQGKDLIGYIEQYDEYRILCVLDELGAGKVLGYDRVAPQDYDLGCRDAILAVGFPKNKLEVLRKYAPLQLNWQSFIDRRAVVSRHATIGPASIIAPFAIVAGDARVGAHVYVAPFSGAGHDSQIGDFCSLLPQSGLGGGARMGDRTLLGTGAKIKPRVSVGADCWIVPMTHVTEPVPDAHVAYGYPTRLAPVAHLQFMALAATGDED